MLKDKFHASQLMSREGKSCPICLEDFEAQAEAGESVDIVQLKCSKLHLFHFQCLETSLKSGQPSCDKCPFCRAEIEV
jgi:hypothetical protein